MEERQRVDGCSAFSRGRWRYCLCGRIANGTCFTCYQHHFPDGTPSCDATLTKTRLMQDFTNYLILAGLSQERAQEEALHINSWEELHLWLDCYSHDETTPPLDRTSLGAPVMETSWKAALQRRFSSMEKSGEPIGNEPVWPKVVERRRRVSMLTTLFLTVLLVIISDQVLVAQHITPFLKASYLTLYAIMSYFMIATFVKLAIGSWHALRGPQGNPWHPAHTATDPDPKVKVAILFPVYHEDPGRVVAGMIATARSLQRHVPHAGMHYEFFLLSDSRQLSYMIAELGALEQARTVCPDMAFHYRWRTSNDHAKLGNITDFCRRWGKRYEYMLVMDADSLMNGGTIHQLLRMMEGNHRLGILQTNPTAILRKSLFGRMQQFAGRLYGTAFSYSLQAMYMGHASYIGHNALIRTQAFITHCLLPDLAGRSPWGGKPLSHDIIEAALMARAGYEVWFLPELEGSYEEIPANILGFLIRERRWMQGNLQHARFLFLEGLHTIHRENFLSGVMGYMSAPLWAMFLIISAWSMISYLKSGHLGVGSVEQIEIPSAMMLVASMVFLFAPRVIAIIINFPHKKSYFFGGKRKILLSTILETIFSFFFAPLMMAFISKFVWLWIKKRSISWGTQQRDDEPLPWQQCIRHFGWTAALGIIATLFLLHQIQSVPFQVVALLSIASGHWLQPMSIFVWFFPILAGLAGSVFVARVTSRTFPALLRHRWFMIPEEVQVPDEINDLMVWNDFLNQKIPDPSDIAATVHYAITDPSFYIRQRTRARFRSTIAERILAKLNNGEKLSLREFMIAIHEKTCLDKLHEYYSVKN
ncbi:Periplasmic glucan glucosyltransferase [Granulibacter bethesdensis]|nr:Periplasmic glucan glucosyltransferase [Granulibacter bethesdensis]